MSLQADVGTLRAAPEQALYVMDANMDVERGVRCQSLWITSARKPQSPAFNSEHFKHAPRADGEFFLPPWIGRNAGSQGYAASWAAPESS